MNKEQLKAMEAFMSKALRNLFAGYALQGLVASGRGRANGEDHTGAVAKLAFRYADAMIRESEKLHE